MTKLEVKVTGKPKPEIKWSKDNEQIFPSEEYQIENFEDGTSVLIINNVYPDDTGVITFEANNTCGEAVTTTELSLEGTWFKFFNKILGLSIKLIKILQVDYKVCILGFPLLSLTLFKHVYT